jgi:hypothetical protein
MTRICPRGPGPAAPAFRLAGLRLALAVNESESDDHTNVTGGTQRHECHAAAVATVGRTQAVWTVTPGPRLGPARAPGPES